MPRPPQTMYSQPGLAPSASPSTAYHPDSFVPNYPNGIPRPLPSGSEHPASRAAQSLPNSRPSGDPSGSHSFNPSTSMPSARIPAIPDQALLKQAIDPRQNFQSANNGAATQLVQSASHPSLTPAVGKSQRDPPLLTKGDIERHFAEALKRSDPVYHPRLMSILNAILTNGPAEDGYYRIPSTAGPKPAASAPQAPAPPAAPLPPNEMPAEQSSRGSSTTTEVPRPPDREERSNTQNAQTPLPQPSSTRTESAPPPVTPTRSLGKKPSQPSPRDLARFVLRTLPSPKKRKRDEASPDDSSSKRRQRLDSPVPTPAPPPLPSTVSPTVDPNPSLLPTSVNQPPVNEDVVSAPLDRPRQSTRAEPTSPAVVPHTSPQADTSQAALPTPGDQLPSIPTSQATWSNSSDKQAIIAQPEEVSTNEPEIEYVGTNLQAPQKTSPSIPPRPSTPVQPPRGSQPPAKPVQDAAEGVNTPVSAPRHPVVVSNVPTIVTLAEPISPAVNRSSPLRENEIAAGSDLGDLEVDELLDDEDELRLQGPLTGTATVHVSQRTITPQPLDRETTSQVPLFHPSTSPLARIRVSPPPRVHRERKRFWTLNRNMEVFVDIPHRPDVVSGPSRILWDIPKGTMLSTVSESKGTSVTGGSRAESVDLKSIKDDYGWRLFEMTCPWKDCNAKLNCVSHLTRHMRRVHALTKPGQCQWKGCHAPLSPGSVAIGKHTKMHAEATRICPFDGCPETFSSEPVMKRHISRLHRPGDTLKRLALPEKVLEGDNPALPKTPMPWYRFVVPAVHSCSISASKHETLEKWVANRIRGQHARIGEVAQYSPRRTRRKPEADRKDDNEFGFMYDADDRNARPFGEMIPLKSLWERYKDEVLVGHIGDERQATVPSSVARPVDRAASDATTASPQGGDKPLGGSDGGTETQVAAPDPLLKETIVNLPAHHSSTPVKSDFGGIDPQFGL
ncbi:hypothetical protein FRB99_001242 [Tulasnella sp. 403]|nr:hypothetical protein FRB99_001242 [Tulasnella sp. 403]